MIEGFVNKHLLAFNHYVVPNNNYKYVLNANESPYNVFEYIMEDYLEKMRTYQPNLYPDPMATQLRKKLANYTGVEPGNIICGNGSDEIITMIFSTFLSQEDVVVSHNPTFDMYSMGTKLAKGKFICVNDDAELKIRSDELIEKVNTHHAKLLFLCLPNNPTGYAMPKEEIIKIMDNTSCIVVIDEAYGEFSDISCIDLIHKYDNIIILKTLSKGFGLAGLRLGYAISTENTINWIYKVKQPYNLNSMSQLLGELVLDHMPLIQGFIDNIKNERDRLMAELLNIEEFKVYPSDANFILVKYKKDSKKLNEYLLSHNLFIKYFSDTHYLADCFRITVSTKEINELLLVTIKEGIAT